MGQALGKIGLDQVFTVGSRWHFGPCRENMETIVEVTEKQSRHSGVGKALLLDRDGKPSWYIDTVVVSSPFYEIGKPLGAPPHTLIPRAAVVAERGECNCQSELDNLRQQAVRWQELVDVVERRAAAAETALRNLRQKIKELST